LFTIDSIDSTSLDIHEHDKSAVSSIGVPSMDGSQKINSA
jgi:hypothetical protein